MRSGYLFLLIFLPGLVVSGNVLAHAELLDTVPANGAVLGQSPEEFVVRFSEPVSVLRIRLLNREREAVELGEVRNVDKELFIELPSPLEDGQYLLSFRVLSLDAHPVSGSVGIAIGDLPAPLPEYSEVDRTALFLARFNRTLHLLAILASVGMVLFPLVFTLPGGLEPQRRRYLYVTTIAGIVTAVVGLGLWGVLLTETSPSAIVDPETWSIAVNTSLGNSTALVICGLLGILMANVLDPELHPGKFSGLLGVLLVIVSIGASGHAAAGGLLISSVFVVHVLVVGIWFGALWLLYRGISLDRAGIVNDMLMRFSTRAVWMVSLLLFTAVFLAIYQLGNVVNLFSSEYGNWLMIKIILVLLVLALAAVNKWKLTPALQEQNGAPRRNLSRSIVSEGILMVIVVAITSVLASTPPPDRETSRLLTLSAGGTDLELRISPARTGENDIGLSFIRGDEPFSPMEVDVFWEQPEAGIEPMSREAVRTGEGQYRVDNVDLLVDGDWQFQVEVLIDDFTRERFETELDVEE